MNRSGAIRVFELGLVGRSLWDFVKGMCLLRSPDPWITIFGSARLGENNPAYRLGRELGRTLGRAGYAVMTGGGPGLMEAVNRGAREGGGRSLGCRMEFPFEQPVNRYFDHCATVRYFFVRKVVMCRRSMGFVVLPGGLGTLDEFFEILTLIQTRRMGPKPIVLLGCAYWSPLLLLLDAMVAAGTVASRDVSLIHVTDDIDHAIALLTEPAETVVFGAVASGSSAA
ncbi:MAG TPA: TIGR00730 family Rossman fold protein [Vicinamibacterales bacterium]|nr:TIGR00730 family Rossman fold protein [Vicinamibacterales bacterium]